MEKAVREVIDSLPDSFSQDLLQNENAMDFHQALEKPLIILRWRNRICQTCSEPFDIEREGRLYQCGRCVK